MQALDEAARAGGEAGAATGAIHPVILSGGVGSRLWPLSREARPKQLLELASERTMIQDTARRASGPGFRPPLVVAADAHRFVIAEQLRQIGLEDARVVLEPEGRNTAPAIAAAALLVAQDDPDALLLVQPADHVIADPAAFRAAVRAGLAAAKAGRLVAFGVTPDRPETGYGYIRRGAALEGADGVFAVARFQEKPTREVAEALLAEGACWNAGIFLFPVRTLLAELERHAPDVLAAAQGAVEGAKADLTFCRLDAAAFARAPKLAIDVALMEKTERAAVVPVAMGWTDVGAWDALWELGAKDEAGNVAVGDVLLQDSRNAYARSEGPLLAVLGLDDVVVVATGDAVLVADRRRAQEVKALFERLKAQGRPEAHAHRRVYRPWGFYQTLTTGERYQVKCLTVKPGAKLSLQKHFHRAEHWVVVAGTARVTRDGEEILLTENQSVYLPLGAVHRLENPGKLDLHLIEVQSGPYLGEDDIVRLEDLYGRG